MFQDAHCATAHGGQFIVDSLAEGFGLWEKIRACRLMDRRKARIFVPKATLRWWRLFIQEHYPKSKPGRPRKERPLVELVTG